MGLYDLLLDGEAVTASADELAARLVGVGVGPTDSLKVSGHRLTLVHNDDLGRSLSGVFADKSNFHGVLHPPRFARFTDGKRCCQ